MEIVQSKSRSDQSVKDQLNSLSKMEVVTLGSLYTKDLPNGFILPERPSSFNPDAKFLNDKRYIIHDIPPWPLFHIEYLKPIQLCLVAGNELPVLVRFKPHEKLKRHWKRWLPFLPGADTRDLALEDTGDRKFITLYPLQWLPKEKHAVDPDVHHKMLSKNTIPEMGANCPTHMDLDGYTVPCIIKVSHGLSGRGTFLAKTKLDAQNIITKIQNEMHCSHPSISEVIEDITGNYCVQFYLHKTGEIKWLGCSKQIVDENYDWKGGYVMWNEQDELKLKLFDTVMPVKEYLHKNGYFGVVGIDVLSNKEGNFVVDVNARINGSTTLLLVAPHIADRGYPVSSLLSIPKAKGNEAEMMEMFDKINCAGEGLVINLASVEAEDGQSCEGHVCMFAKTEEGMQNLYDTIIDDDNDNNN